MTLSDLWALTWVFPNLRNALKAFPDLRKQTLANWDQFIHRFQVSQYLGPIIPFFKQ